MTPRKPDKLLPLLERLVEQRATAEDIAQLEQIVLGDPAARRRYVEYMQLHGMLHWDAAGGGGVDPARLRPATVVSRRRMWAWWGTGLASATAALILLAVFLSPAPQPAPQQMDSAIAIDPAPAPNDGNAMAGSGGGMVIPEITLSPRGGTPPAIAPPADPQNVAVAPPSAPHPLSPAPVVGESDEEVIAFINAQLAAGWTEQGIVPSPPAGEAELLRRTWLDLAGRIPTRAEASAYLNDQRTDRHARLVSQLLDSSEYPRHFSTVWTNLLVGRAPEQEINRDLLLGWMREGFADNRPWDDTVTQLLTAQGSANNSPPANFLLAHLNNEAVPATAVTARILLCEQLQCAQCHTHPVVKDWGQERFWEINAFFRNTAAVDPPAGPRGRRPPRRLVDRNGPYRPSYYETLQGVMRIAYPKVGDVEFTTPPDQPLRQELAKLLLAGDRPQPARALVNRTWAQLFGYGFTHPLDDMGPHQPVSHPELLEGLTLAFARSGFDVKRLIGWIVRSDAYQRTSAISEGNSSDDPAAGETPRFSRMYVKSLPPEQLYDSLVIASGVAPEELLQPVYERRRNEWLRQFFRAVENEENGEATTLDGTLPQALLMMNGELIDRATSLEPGSELARIFAEGANSDADRIQQVCLSALSRRPTDAEVDRLRDLIRARVRQQINAQVPAAQARQEALRDVYWALLNSGEFAVNH